jgi:hypothetical protein
VLKKLYGSKKEEVTGDWRKMHSEELCNVLFSANIIRMMKSRRIR